MLASVSMIVSNHLFECIVTDCNLRLYTTYKANHVNWNLVVPLPMSLDEGTLACESSVI